MVWCSVANPRQVYLKSGFVKYNFTAEMKVVFRYIYACTFISDNLSIRVRIAIAKITNFPIGLHRRCSNYIWVINNFIAYLCASYIRDLTVGFAQFYPYHSCELRRPLGIVWLLQCQLNNLERHGKMSNLCLLITRWLIVRMQWL